MLLTVGPSAHDRHAAADDNPFRQVFIIGSDRTGAQDVTFFIDQLVELAVRALSPGINDPGTARLCIDRLEHALCHLASRRFPSPWRQDDSGRVRVLARPLSFESIIESAFAEITRHGRSSVSVSCRLLEAIGSIAWCVRRDDDRRALLRQAAEIAAQPHPSPLSEGDRDRIARCHRETLAALQDRF